MMKKSVALILALVMLVATLCTGCSSEGAAEGISLVVIGGYHANACKPTAEMLEQSGLTKLIASAIDYYEETDGYCHAKANIKFIVCDGNPEVVELTHDGEPINMHYESGNFPTLYEDMRYLAEDIVAALQTDALMADDDEVDLLAALSMAGDLLRQNPGIQNHILVLDTGITTDGFLRMQDEPVRRDIQRIGGAEDPAATAKEVVGRLANGAITDLSNTYVTFYGMGNVDGVTQKVITDQLIKDSLTGFWTAYFDECGAKLTTDLLFTVNQGGKAMIHNTDGGSYPYVSNVPFEISKADPIPVDPDDPQPLPPDPEDTLHFNENTLTFKPNSAEFRNRATAIAEIKNNQSYFDWSRQKDPNVIFYVVGSIAMAEPGRTKENGTISLDRAREVAKIMVEECGIPASQIMLIPAGLTKLPWRNNEEYPNGQETEETATNKQLNRVVAIVPSVFSDPMNSLSGGAPGYVNLLDWAVPYSD